MSRADVDAFLAECDDVIDDWEGSTDSATWAADGSHEHDTCGHYYGDDGWLGGTVPLVPFAPRQNVYELMWNDWQEQLIRAFEPTMLRMNELARQMVRAHRGFAEFSAAQRTLQDGFRSSQTLMDETIGWRNPSPINEETRALLDSQKVDPMQPPAYLYRPRP